MILHLKLFPSIALLFSLNYSSLKASDSDLLLKRTIESILHAYNEKNQVLLNEYIYPKWGMYYILNQNNEIYWIHRKIVCLNSECMNSYNMEAPYSQILLEQKTDPLPQLSIDKKNLHILTKTIRNYRQDKEINTKNINLQYIWEVESKSVRVEVIFEVIDSFGRSKFVFYLTLLDRKWYLSIIDFS